MTLAIMQFTSVTISNSRKEAGFSNSEIYLINNMNLLQKLQGIFSLL